MTLLSLVDEILPSEACRKRRVKQIMHSCVSCLNWKPGIVFGVSSKEFPWAGEPDKQLLVLRVIHTVNQSECFTHKLYFECTSPGSRSCAWIKGHEGQ